MFEVLPIDSPSVSTTVWLTLSMLLVYKLVSWYRRYTAWVAIYDKLPGDRDKHWLWGHIHKHPGPNEEGVLWQLAFTKLFPKWHCVWFGRIRPILICHHPDSVKSVLKQSAALAPKPRGPGTSYEIGLNWLGEGLLIANGNRWARNRRLLTPAFHYDILRPYVNIANQCTELLLDKVQGFCDSKTDFEAMEHIGLCSLDIITRCAFSYESHCQIQGDKNPYVQAVHRLSELWMLRSLRPDQVLDWVYFNLTSNGREFTRLCKYLHSVTEDIIVKRREVLVQEGVQKREHNEGKRILDFLDIILTAKDDDGVGLSDLDIRNECDTFMFEGHDTTMSNISFLMMSLAQHPEIQEKCRQEMDEVLEGKDNDCIEWKDLPKLEYLTQVVKEGLRMHPSVFFIQRQVAEDTTIDGYHIPAWTNVAINIHNLHHNESVWGKDHDEFKPERFTPDNVAKMDPFAFIPFSAGPRNCIGQNFAMNEIKVMVGRLVHRFKFAEKKGHVVRKRMGVVMRSEDGIWLTATPR